MSKPPENYVRKSFQVQQCNNTYPVPIPNSLVPSSTHSESRQNSGNLYPNSTAPAYGIPVKETNLVPQVLYDLLKELQKSQNVTQAEIRKTDNIYSDVYPVPSVYNTPLNETHLIPQVVYQCANKSESGQNICTRPAKRRKEFNHGQIQRGAPMASAYNTVTNPVIGINPSFQGNYSTYSHKLHKGQTVESADKENRLNHIQVHPVPSTLTCTEVKYIDPVPQVVYDYVDELENRQKIATTTSTQVAKSNRLPRSGDEVQKKVKVRSARRRNPVNVAEIPPVVPQASSYNVPVTDINSIPQVVHELVRESNNHQAHIVEKKKHSNCEKCLEERKARSRLERARVREISQAYKKLKAVISKVAPGEKLSNNNVVKLATSYIKFLEHVISTQNENLFTAEEKSDEAALKKKMCEVFRWWSFTQAFDE